MAHFITDGLFVLGAVGVLLMAWRSFTISNHPWARRRRRAQRERDIMQRDFWAWERARQAGKFNNQRMTWSVMQKRNNGEAE
jgi:hypothetical protein